MASHNTTEPIEPGQKSRPFHSGEVWAKPGKRSMRSPRTMLARMKTATSQCRILAVRVWEESAESGCSDDMAIPCDRAQAGGSSMRRYQQDRGRLGFILAAAEKPAGPLLLLAYCTYVCCIGCVNKDRKSVV